MASLPEGPWCTDPDVAQLIAERDLRQQHRYTMRWGKADQHDEDQWTIHDSEHAQQYGYRYATCRLCHAREDANAHD